MVLYADYKAEALAMCENLRSINPTTSNAFPTGSCVFNGQGEDVDMVVGEVYSYMADDTLLYIRQWAARMGFIPSSSADYGDLECFRKGVFNLIITKKDNISEWWNAHEICCALARETGHLSAVARIAVHRILVDGDDASTGFQHGRDVATRKRQRRNAELSAKLRQVP